MLLYGGCLFSKSALSMQLIHLSINIATVILLLKSPFSLTEKILIVFGYYLFYEYNIISRNYGICILLLIALFTIYTRHKEDILKLSLLIFMMANTHLFGLALAGAFIAMYGIMNRDELRQISLGKNLLAGTIILTGLIVATLSIIPPEHYGQHFLKYESSGYFSAERIIKTTSVCLKGLFYLPNYMQYNTENRMIYTQLLGILQLLLAIIAYIIPILFFRKNKAALIFFISFSVLYSTVYYFLPLVHGMRYFGFYYFVFIVCYWLAYHDMSRSMKTIAMLIFMLQFVNGIYAYTKDILYPFSESKNIVEYLNKNVGNEKVYIASPICRPAISVYTGKKYYDFATEKEESFSLWYLSVSADTIQQHLEETLLKEHNVLLITTQPSIHVPDSTKLQKLAVFDKGFMEGENATIYRYH